MLPPASVVSAPYLCHYAVLPSKSRRGQIESERLVATEEGDGMQNYGGPPQGPYGYGPQGQQPFAPPPKKRPVAARGQPWW